MKYLYILISLLIIIALQSCVENTSILSDDSSNFESREQKDCCNVEVEYRQVSTIEGCRTYEIRINNNGNCRVQLSNTSSQTSLGPIAGLSSNVFEFTYCGDILPIFELPELDFEIINSKGDVCESFNLSGCCDSFTIFQITEIENDNADCCKFNLLGINENECPLTVIINGQISPLMPGWVDIDFKYCPNGNGLSPLTITSGSRRCYKFDPSEFGCN